MFEVASSGVRTPLADGSRARHNEGTYQHTSRSVFELKVPSVASYMWHGEVATHTWIWDAVSIEFVSAAMLAWCPFKFSLYRGHESCSCLAVGAKTEGSSQSQENRQPESTSEYGIGARSAARCIAGPGPHRCCRYQCHSGFMRLFPSKFVHTVTVNQRLARATLLWRQVYKNGFDLRNRYTALRSHCFVILVDHYYLVPHHC